MSTPDKNDPDIESDDPNAREDDEDEDPSSCPGPVDMFRSRVEDIGDNQ